MKNINEVFTDDEFHKLDKIKKASGLTWHDLIIESIELHGPRYGDLTCM